MFSSVIEHYYLAHGLVEWLHGKRGAESVGKLRLDATAIKGEGCMTLLKVPWAGLESSLKFRGREDCRVL